MARSRAAIVLAGLMAAATSASAQTNLVQNGDFSSYTNNNGQSPDQGFQVDYNGTLNNWSSGGGNPYYNFLFLAGTAQSPAADTGVYGQYAYLGLWDNTTASNGWDGNGPPGIGGNFMAMDGDFGTGPLTQTITGLTQGTVYAVTFWYAFAQQSGFTGPTVQDLTVGLGASKSSVPAFALASQAFSGWMQDTVYVEANSSTDVLSFLASGNVQLPPFALLADISMVDAPEPATWAMMGVGLAGLIGAARLRRGKTMVSALS